MDIICLFVYFDSLHQKSTFFQDPDHYSNLFLNAYINHHAHNEYLKMIEVYSPLGIWHVFLYSINTNIYHFWSMKDRQYA